MLTLKFAKIKELLAKMKNTKTKNTNNIDIVRLSVVIVALLVFVGGSVSAPLVLADRFDDQINALNRDTDKKQVAQDQLGAQASSISDQISRLQNRINSIQNRIDTLNGQINELKRQIKVAEDELVVQRKILGEIIRQMYVKDDVSTLEMLASSSNLSEFFDKQQYRESVRNKIKNSVDKITTLKVQLKSSKDKVEKSLNEQKTLRGEILAQRNEKDRLLGLNLSQQRALEKQMQKNNQKVQELRRAQAIENSKHGSGLIVGSRAGGGYPAYLANAPQDSLIDPWGMYNRECVSYTAWKVYQRFGKNAMPYWGGVGNANQWPGNTNRKFKTPKPGDVAIAYWGPYGHAMFVERVSGSQVYVSQYNYDYNGTYSEMWINISEIDWFLRPPF